MTAKAFHALRVSSLVAFNRAHAFLYSLAILALLRHRLACLLASPTLLPAALFLADLVLAVMWVASQSFRWRPVSRQEFPDRLLREIGPDGLPALDVFICTADPHKEPPISVVGTALSAMSFDYPTDRLSVYVSDDGGSAVTLFAFMEAARFARYWLPFCKQNGLLERSPEAYFRSNKGADSEKMKLRVSSTMSNAPVILTLDCDTYCSDPRSPLLALCYLLDPALSSNLAFVQFPQRFYGINKNDIYGGEIKRLYTITARGKDGLLGPSYFGSGCFISRRSLQGIPSSPSLAQEARVPSSSESVLRKAHEVAGCTYELRTKWGSVMGFRYGSLVEDYYTSFRLHCQGWRSVFCNPVRPAFLGDVPKNLNDVLGQCKRWCVGLLEVGFSRYSPLTFGTTNASLLAGLGYAYDAFWGIWCIPVTTYGLLPQLALISQTTLFPKVSDPWFYLYVYLFTAAYGQDLVEFLADDGTIGRWWSDQRMWMIKGVTAYLFGTVQFALKKIGISAAEFNVTSKVMDDEQFERYERGAFDLGVQSPFFVALGTVAVVNLSSLVVGIARAATTEGFLHEQFAQLFLSGFVAANCWPIYEAMFLRSDGGRMPTTITVISLMVAGLLLFMGFIVFHL
ncbi:hypothetical protein B296_00058024 [Ensete ventricosum]|uniref:Glycosyltransferase 2-like domain-containing protein n=1 Tax=Ensete ventricosum TaxID=4639 RepID=A0A426XNT6_ENSVE|nr:hypothetical protein B296_00058024 [Ensete ventricosum]